MPQFFSNKRLIILLVSIIILVALIGFSMKDREELTWPEKFLKDTVGFTQSIFYKPANLVAGFFENIGEMKNMYHENKLLKAKLDEYAQMAVDVKRLNKENKDLRKQLGIQGDLSDYKVRQATVIGRSPDKWNKFIFIDKGSNAGVQPKMAVRTTEGFIGKVVKVGAFYSTVQLISDNDRTNRVSAIVQGNKRVFGTIEGYDDKKRRLLLKKIPIEAKVKKGQKVVTSGLGEVFPSGLLIGEVTDVKPDEYGLTKTAYVKPAADLYDLDHVMILDRTAQKLDENVLNEKGEE
ncbi:rod shape-determining protein MreC [Fictibacillus sp. Mic-4]|uniref:rod shape-determining protein MreC n=1 Tax=Fictibacillus TaxID=1329200 RepID=UPI000401D48D|nr:rod shape-determining protein MreC [Fictibacillus gelatini]